MKTISKKVSAVSKKNFPLYIAFDQHLEDGNDEFQFFNFASKKERDAFVDGFWHMRRFCGDLNLDVNLDATIFSNKKEYVSFVRDWRIRKLEDELCKLKDNLRKCK